MGLSTALKIEICGTSISMKTALKNWGVHIRKQPGVEIVQEVKEIALPVDDSGMVLALNA